MLTCEKYLNTRAKGVKDTWSKDLDIIHLSDKMNIREDVFSYEIPGGYSDMSKRYIEFFRNEKIGDYDWIIFCDDDSYFNMKNLYKLLENYDSNDKISIGRVGRLNPDATDMSGNFTGFPLNTIKGNNTHLPIDYYSGGAGFILSKPLFDDLQNYIKNEKNLADSYNTDVTMGFWLRSINSKLIHFNDKFCHNNPFKNNLDIHSIVSCHYVTPEEMKKLNEIIYV